LRRIIKVHSFEGDNLLDFCAGSGSFGYAAAELNRSCVLIDNNPSAIEIMARRFEKFSPEIIEG
jgi:site-specific DNA-methyltransferase (adenine-specific)